MSSRLSDGFCLSLTKEEDIYDTVADMKAVQKVDVVTGKEKHQPRARVPLFLPGRIIHITWGAPKYRYQNCLT